MNDFPITRRTVLGFAAAMLAACGRGAPVSAPRPSPASPPARNPPPAGEFVNAFEFEEEARLLLPPETYATVRGSDREPFDRITFRPRVGVPTLDMDLTVRLFGDEHFAPLVVGPVADQGRFNPQAESATVAGAGAAYTSVVVSGRSTIPIEEVARLATTPIWFSVAADDSERPIAQRAADAGARALVISTAGPDGRSDSRTAARGRTRIDWKAVDAVRGKLALPIVLKGIQSGADAATALREGVDGLIVSDHGRPSAAGRAAPLDVLPTVDQVVSGRVPVLVDGGFRRGTDILKALALGASAVLVARPVMWGLATHGEEGVRTVLELMQTELARSIGMLGVPRPDLLRADHVRRHRQATA